MIYIFVINNNINLYFNNLLEDLNSFVNQANLIKINYKYFTISHLLQG